MNSHCRKFSKESEKIRDGGVVQDLHAIIKNELLQVQACLLSHLDAIETVVIRNQLTLV